MAEQYPQGQANNSATEEIKGHGFFYLTTKKEDKTEDVVIMRDHQLNALKESKEEKHTLMDKLQRTHSHSSSSSDEEVEEGGERKKKKKKGLKDAIKEKISAHDHKQGENDMEKKCNEEEIVKQADLDNHPHEEKKGFLEKMKEKLPGHRKGTEEEKQSPPDHSGSTDHAKEKKGIIDMIKDKLPGHHKNNENDDEVKKDK